MSPVSDIDCPDLARTREAVAEILRINDDVLWQALGVQLSGVLALMDAQALCGIRPEMPEGLRYIVYNIKDAMASFRLIAGLTR